MEKIKDMSEFPDCLGDDYVIIVEGDPKAQKRHRHRVNGKYAIPYDPSGKDKKNFLQKAKIYCPPDKVLEGALHVYIVFYMPRPKNHFGTGRNSDKLKASAPEFHTSKPDIDNLAKFVLDALSKTYFKDDNQVINLLLEKQYDSVKPRTIVRISEI